MTNSAVAIENESSVLELDSAISEQDMKPAIDKIRPKKGAKTKSSKLIPFVVVIAFFAVGLVGVFYVLKGGNSTEADSIESLKSALLSDFVDRDSYIALQEKVNDISGVIRDIPAQLIALSSKTDEIRSDLDVSKAKLIELNDWTQSSSTTIDEMGNRISALEEANKRKAIASKKKTNRPKFNLDIDGLGVWNGVPFVSVGYQGKYAMIEVGQRVNGWLLVSLDRVTRVAKFEHKTGKKINVKV